MGGQNLECTDVKKREGWKINVFLGMLTMHLEDLNVSIELFETVRKFFS